MTPALNRNGVKQPMRFVAVDASGVPTTRDIPIYSLWDIVAEHQRTTRRAA